MYLNNINNYVHGKNNALHKKNNQMNFFQSIILINIK